MYKISVTKSVSSCSTLYKQTYCLIYLYSVYYINELSRGQELLLVTVSVNKFWLKKAVASSTKFSLKMRRNVFSIIENNAFLNVFLYVVIYHKNNSLVTKLFIFLFTYLLIWHVMFVNRLVPPSVWSCVQNDKLLVVLIL